MGSVKKLQGTKVDCASDAAAALPLYVDSSHIVTLDMIEQALEMLKAGRIDLFVVGTQIENLEVMKRNDHSTIKRVGIVETKTLYPWLHTRHKDLVKPLAETLKALKAEGFNGLPPVDTDREPK